MNDPIKRVRVRATFASLVLFYGFFALSSAITRADAPPKPACDISAVERSGRIIRAILDDLDATYKQDGGGGISEIRQVATDVFRISLLQEERIDHLTYHLAVNARCDVKILRKDESVTSFDRSQASP